MMLTYNLEDFIDANCNWLAGLIYAAIAHDHDDNTAEILKGCKLLNTPYCTLEVVSNGVIYSSLNEE